MFYIKMSTIVTKTEGHVPMHSYPLVVVHDKCHERKQHEMISLYSTRRFLCFALGIKPNANEIYIRRKLFYLYTIWIFNPN